MTVSHRPDWVDESLYPFTSHVIEIDGNTVHYVDEGPETAPSATLLFLHGNPTWSFVYRDVIRDLRGQFRCIALDYPGFGLSGESDEYTALPDDHTRIVTAFIDRLDLTDLTLVAHDWGGPIGLAAIARDRSRFTGVVLANTWAWPVTALHVKIMSYVMGGPVGALLIRHLNLFVNVMIPAGHKLRKPSDAEMNHYRNALDTGRRRQGSSIFPRQLTAGHDFLAAVADALPDLATLPALIIWADADIAFGDAELKRWESTFADHHIEIIHGASHFVQSDAPDQFAAAIRAWFDTRGSDTRGAAG
ncbi:alpha/beta fold hydrolase [Gordonia sp. NPDC003504]